MLQSGRRRELGIGGETMFGGGCAQKKILRSSLAAAHVDAARARAREMQHTPPSAAAQRAGAAQQRSAATAEGTRIPIRPRAVRTSYSLVKGRGEQEKTSMGPGEKRIAVSPFLLYPKLSVASRRPSPRRFLSARWAATCRRRGMGERSRRRRRQRRRRRGAWGGGTAARQRRG